MSPGGALPTFSSQLTSALLLYSTWRAARGHYTKVKSGHRDTAQIGPYTSCRWWQCLNCPCAGGGLTPYALSAGWGAGLGVGLSGSRGWVQVPCEGLLSFCAAVVPPSEVLVGVLSHVLAAMPEAPYAVLMFAAAFWASTPVSSVPFFRCPCYDVLAHST